MKVIKQIFALVIVFLVLFPAIGEPITWTGDGVDGLWFTPENWSGNSVPSASDDVLITNGSVEYIAGNDLVRDTGTTLTMGPGGSFIQTGGIAWMQIYGTIVLENGSSFDTGSAGAFHLHDGGSVVLNSGGLFRRAGHTFVANDKWVFNGGIIDNGMAEFQFNAEIDFNGVIYTGKLAPQNTEGILNARGGHIYLRDSSWDSFYQVGSAHLNFPAGSDCVISITNCSPEEIYDRYFSGDSPRMRYDGETVAENDFASVFIVEASDSFPGGTDLYLIPQEVDGVASFVSESCVMSNLTATGATFYAAVDFAGVPAADLFVLYGTANGGAVFANWENKISLGTAVSDLNYTYPVSLNSNFLYYFRFAATNESGTAYATPSPVYFMTGDVAIEAPETVPENSPVPASVVISRPEQNNCANVELSVPFTLGGTAQSGVHYTLSTESPARIPVGESSVTLSLFPKPDWNDKTERAVTLSLDPNARYMLSESNSVTITFTEAVLPSAPTNAFVGSVSTSSLDPDNWSLGVVPTSEHIVVFSPEYAQNDLDWLPGSTSVVAGWRQPYAFTPADTRVLFHTTPQQPLTITGDCYLEGGYWVHEGPSNAPVYAVSVNIGGDLFVGAGAQINAGNGGVNQANGMARGFYLAGPGYRPSEGDDGTGSSYGGEGATNNVTYGSVLNPLNYGSSGRGDNLYFSGGGLIILKVDGTTTLNGKILSNGFSYPGSGRGGSTGGTINITTSSLSGNGVIAADGGEDSTYGSGSGGRIRIKLEDPAAMIDDFTGTITARGNYGSDTVPGSAAGTIALQMAGDTESSGVVIVDNIDVGDGPFDTAMCTHLPPKLDTDERFTATTWVLKNHAAVRLTKNIRLLAIGAEGNSARLFTDGFDVTARMFSVDDELLPCVVYTADDYPDFIFGTGSVIVEPEQTVISIK
ncbi:MAG: hypothetical protein GX804_04870 [Lentisphaerae bacterium]|nr:hypothetical protein [Lentisphaerota bacterium]